MTQLPISDSQPRMGRPPLNLTDVLVRLFADQPERIDAAVGKNKRSQFIRDLVENELKRLEAEKKS